MTRLERRKASQENIILERRFIRTVLREEGNNILAQQTKKMNRSGFTSRELFADRKIDATDTVLSFDHLMKHRFIDMKRRRTITGVVKKRVMPFTTVCFMVMPITLYVAYPLVLRKVPGK